MANHLSVAIQILDWVARKRKRRDYWIRYALSNIKNELDRDFIALEITKLQGEDYVANVSNR